MVSFRLWIVTLFFLTLTRNINGVTHWVVTENGKIEANFESPFNIRKPYDLLALLEQEERLKEINNLYSELLQSKKNIDQKFFKLKDISNIGNKLDDYDCLTKGKALSNVDFYSSHSMDDNILKDVRINLKDKYDSVADQEPDCEKYSELELGTISIDNLESVKNYDKISLVPDNRWEKTLGIASIEHFGHEVSEALKENSTSWLHYNLASLYWRIKNVGPKAVQCSRRAIHFASDHYRDIPLHMLAGVLHQARDSEDAAELLLAAIDLAPEQPRHLLALGNVYASLAEYNKSVIYYDKYLELRPDQDVIANKYAALCFWKLENDLWKLENEVADILKFFQGILVDLHNYHDRQSYWLKLHERSLWEQVSFEKQLVSMNTQGVRGTLQLKSLNKKCVQEMMANPDKFVSCDLTNSNEVNEFEQFDMESLFSFIESEMQQINKYLAKGKEEILKKKEAVPMVEKLEEKVSAFADIPKIPESTKTFYFDDPKWPEKKDCQKWNLPLNEVENLYLPVYLPLSEKGYNVKNILSSLIGIPENKEHELPWYPPSCDDWDTSDRHMIPPYEKKASAEFKSNNYLRNHLLIHVNHGKAEEAEIGQRIVTAMDKKVAPPWVLGTLASLYWRVRGNYKKALTCLDFSLKNAQDEDPGEVVMLSVASITHQLGYTDDAITFATQAFQQNEADPSTNFLLALLHYKKNKPLMALYYLKNALRADQNYYEGLAENLLRIWSCRLRMGAFPDVQNSVRQKVDKTCNDNTATGGEEGGEGVICSLRGENCRTAAVQCFRRESVPDTDGEVKDEHSCIKHQVTNDGSSLQSLLVDHSLTDSDQLMMEGSVQAFHMKISLGDNLAPIVALMDDPVPDVLVQVYEKSGTLLLSPMRCQQIKEAEWVYFTSMWQSIATRNVDIGNYLKPMSKPLRDDMKPYCSRSIPSTYATMDHITLTMLLKNRLPNSPEKALLEWLGLMAGDQKASLKELGAKISIALKDNGASWVLANAAGLFWRIVGNTEEAIVCLRQALAYVPGNMMDVPLISLANILNRVGYHNDALEAAYTAIKSHPNYVFNHFTAGNIHTAMGDFEKAISFYRSSLALDANFAPARNRLLAISCMFLYDESGSLRELTDASDN